MNWFKKGILSLLKKFRTIIIEIGEDYARFKRNYKTRKFKLGFR